MSVHLYEHLVRTKVRMKNPEYQLSDNTIDLLLSAVRIALVAFYKDVKPASVKEAIDLLSSEDEFQESLVYALQPITDLEWNVPTSIVEDLARSIIVTYGELLAMDNFDGMRALIGAIQAPSMGLTATADFLTGRGYRCRYVEDGVEFQVLHPRQRKIIKQEVRSVTEARAILNEMGV